MEDHYEDIVWGLQDELEEELKERTMQYDMRHSQGIKKVKPNKDPISDFQKVLPLMLNTKKFHMS